MSHTASKSVFSPLVIALALTFALGLAGCGRRGSLEAPEGAGSAKANQTSGQTAAGRLTPGTGRNTTQLDPANRDPLSQPTRGSDGIFDDDTPIPAPNRPFILDAIL